MTVKPVSKSNVRSRRTQVERTAETRSALIVAGRRLFGRDGFSEVGTESIVGAAGVTRVRSTTTSATRPACSPPCDDQVEEEIGRRVAGAVGERDPANTIGILLAGAAAWLDASSEPDLQRIVLLDGPAVLGWRDWREICRRHTVGLVAALIQDGIDRGSSDPSRCRPRPTSL